jgi:outer membrane protein assembly factor BamB
MKKSRIVFLKTPTPLLAAMISLALLPCLPCRSADWPNWRGLNQAGIWEDVRLPEKFGPETVTTSWRVKIGGGYSGVAVSNGRVLTMDRPEGKETERVICLDAKTGGTLWQWEYKAAYGDLSYNNGPRATPTVNEDFVYSLGATGLIHCLALSDGKKSWSLDCEAVLKAKRPIWGHASSAVVRGDLVYFHIGGRPGGTLIALEKKTGKLRWKALSDRPGYSTLLPISMHKKDQLLAFTADNLASVSPETGKLIYKTPFKTSNYDVAIISPVVMGNSVFVSGYWDGSALFKIDDKLQPKTAWTTKSLSCLMATPLHLDGHLYALDKRNGLLCLDLGTGKVLWKDGYQMTKKERNPHASMVWGEKQKGMAVILNAGGDLILARLSPQGYSERGRVHLLDGRWIWSHPAFAGQDIFARSDTEIIRVRISPPTD